MCTRSLDHENAVVSQVVEETVRVCYVCVNYTYVYVLYAQTVVKNDNKIQFADLLGTSVWTENRGATRAISHG